MKRIIWGAGITLTAVVVIAAAVCQGTAASASRAAAARVERGNYLVSTIGCHDCHTPKKFGPNGPEIDTTRLLSGHPEGTEMPAPPASSQAWMMIASADLTAFSGPWGISYAMNLTPDQNTGIGIWTEDMFLSALKTGRHMGVSRPILPPMPWTAFRNLSDEDLKAIFAYLRSIPPVHNRIPDPVPPAGAAN